MTKSRAIRGATTSKNNTKDSIIEATKELLSQMIESNSIELENISFAIFTLCVVRTGLPILKDSTNETPKLSP